MVNLWFSLASNVGPHIINRVAENLRYPLSFMLYREGGTLIFQPHGTTVRSVVKVEMFVATCGTKHYYIQADC